MKKSLEVVFGDGKHSIQAQLNGARGLLADIRGGYEAAVSRALNRSLASGRAAAVSAIRQEYAIKASKVRKRFSLERATRQSLEGVLSAKGPNLPLSDFKFKPKEDTTGNARKPVRVSVKNKGGLKRLGDSFVWKGLILKRVGTASLPVTAPKGPAVPILAGNPAVEQSVEAVMTTVFSERLDHEVTEIMRSGLKNRRGKQDG